MKEEYRRGWDRREKYHDYHDDNQFGDKTLSPISSVLISGCWNRGVPLYTEVPSFQDVGIEEFHCIQRYPHFRVLE